jgi:prepilin-type N-terminal cleavage/methylation domain-containing protein
MSNRRGFTLVELLIVVVLGGFVLAAVFQVLVSNQRVYTAQSATVMGQQTVRGAVELLTSEIRELSTGADPALGSDLLLMESDRIQMRVMRKVAVLCGINRANPLEVRGSIMGAAFVAGDSVLIHADGADSPDDHFWTRGVVSETPATGTPAACGGEDSRRLRIDDVTPPIGPTDVDAGSLIRSYETVEYATVTLDGETYLGRSLGGAMEPVIGPLAPNGGLRFEYLDIQGDPTTIASDVRTIRLTVQTLSGARDARGEQIADSLSVFVNPRN